MKNTIDQVESTNIILDTILGLSQTLNDLLEDNITLLTAYPSTDESEKKKANRLATKLLALSSATTSETKQAQTQIEQSVKALIENNDNAKWGVLKVANRRLISKSIHQSDKFLQLSIEDRYLYDELVLYADDDGFCSQLTMINIINRFTDDNYQELERAGFIIVSDGVVLIVDWLNNQDLKNHTNTQQIELAKTTYIRTDWRYTTDPNDEDVAMTLNDFIHKYGSKKTGIELEKLKDNRNALIKAEKALNNSSVEEEKGLLSHNKAEKALPKNNAVQAIERQGIDTSSSEPSENRLKKAEKALIGSETAPNINKYNLKESNINKEKQSLPQKFPTVSQIKIEQLIKFINSKFKATFSNSDEELALFLSNELKKSSVEQIKDNLMAIKDKLEFTPENNNLCLSVIKNEYPNIMRELEENDIDDDFPI